MFLNKGVHVFVLTKLPSSRFIFNFLLLYFDLMISSDSLSFLFLYLASLDNVFGCSQLKWPWHSKQCSVAPELSHFPLSFYLSCWCSIVLVITFFFVSPMYSALQLQFNGINTRVRIRYKFRLNLTQDGLQISSWCKYSLNVFLFKFCLKLRAKDWHSW